MPDGQSMAYVAREDGGALVLIPTQGTGYRIVEADMECGSPGVAFGRQFSASDGRAPIMPAGPAVSPLPDIGAVMAICHAQMPPPRTARAVIGQKPAEAR